MVVLPLGVLAAVVIGLVVLLLLHGAQYIANWLGELLPTINLGISKIHLGNVVRTGAIYALSKVQDAFDSALQPALNLILAPVYIAKNLVANIINTVQEAAGTAAWIVLAFIPRELSRVRSYVRAKVAGGLATAEAYTRRYLSYAERYTRTYVAAAIKAAVHDVTALSARVESYVRHLLADIAAGVSRAEQYARRYVLAYYGYALTHIAELRAELRRDVAVIGNTTTALGVTITRTAAGLTAAIAQAETTAVTAAATAITTDIEHVTHAVWIDLDDAVSAAVGVAATDFPDITAWLRDISTTAATDIAGVTALSVATAGTLARYLEQCGMPNCRNLSKFGRDLQDLFRLFEGGTFLAVLAEMIADPEGAARDVESVVGPIASGVADTARSLLGVA